MCFQSNFDKRRKCHGCILNENVQPSIIPFLPHNILLFHEPSEQIFPLPLEVTDWNYKRPNRSKVFQMFLCRTHRKKDPRTVRFPLTPTWCPSLKLFYIQSLLCCWISAGQFLRELNATWQPKQSRALHPDFINSESVRSVINKILSISRILHPFLNYF